MSDHVLRTQNLSKQYGGFTAVDDLSITVRSGDIYGLIGRNGAGKTTLIRMITSLTMPSGGDIALFGSSDADGLARGRRRIGCIVESPAFYPNLSAKQNLEYYRLQRGIPDKRTVDKVLSVVGLTDAGKKSFKAFSLGMKQRLGLALALLNNPDFIILDEPINGLDPMGIVEMRETLLRLNAESGITMMVSSHILSELSLIANRYGIINGGKLIRELTDDELKEQCRRSLRVVVDDAAKAAIVIEMQLHTRQYKVTSANEIRLYDYLDNAAEVTHQLYTGGIRVSTINEIGDNLEDYFISLVGEGK